MKTSITVTQVAAASGVDATTLRNWLAHSEFQFGSRGLTGRWAFNRQDAIGIALAGELVKHGQAPRRALVEANRLIIRARELDLVAVASTDPKVCATLVPLDTNLPDNGAVIVVALPPLRARVDAYLARR